MKQVLFALTTGVPSGTEYLAIMGSPGTWGTESATRAPWPAAGVFRNLVIELNTAPGAGTSRTLTLRKGGAGTALTVTIADTATTGRLTGVDVSVAVGDLVAMQVTASGSPASSAGFRWSLEFEGTTAKESGYAQSIGGSAAGGGNRFTGVFSFPSATLTAAANARNVVAAAGTLVRLVAAVATSLSATNGYTFYINLNGVRQDGTGATVNTACALLSGTSANATFSLPLAAGDVIYIEAIVTGTFTTRNWSLGTAFVATTDGDSQVCGCSSTTLSTTATQFGPLPTMSLGPGATETTFGNRTLGGVTSVRLSGFRVLLATAPGAGTSRTLQLRVNASSPGPSITISDSATTGSDLTNTGDVADGQLWNLRSQLTGTPAAAVAHWGFIQRIATAAVARGTPFVGPLIVTG